MVASLVAATTASSSLGGAGEDPTRGRDPRPPAAGPDDAIERDLQGRRRRKNDDAAALDDIMNRVERDAEMLEDMAHRDENKWGGGDRKKGNAPREEES